MRRWLKRIALALLLLVVVAGAGAWWLLRGSLPTLDGDITIAGLSAPATIRRDALGVVTIDAANETDAMRALGYVHAQERFFEMDLMRRTAAGELAELFGPVALDLDKQHRVHRMRQRAMTKLDVIAGDKRPQLQAYTDGVAMGLAGLETRPWPYLLLGQQPAPWQMADSALTGYAMYFDLQDEENTREIALSNLRPHLPPALFALLVRDGTPWDAPLVGDARGDAELPDAATLDLRRLPAPTGGAIRPMAAKGTPGSNNFAVSGDLTADGRAIVADDMHLGLRAPNIWFRARLRYNDAAAPAGKVDVQGFTLPGIPAVIVGSNGHVAWGFTNSYVDNIDSGAYCLVDGSDCAEFTQASTERILVRGAEPHDMRIRTLEPLIGPARFSIPIALKATDSQPLATMWSAHRDEAISFDLARMAAARSVDDLLRKPIDGIPAQNIVMADAGGRIAWTIAGNVPEHVPGCDPFSPGDLWRRRPIPDRTRSVQKRMLTIAPVETERREHRLDAPAQPMLQDGCRGNSRTTDDRPQLVDPPANRLWTANNRTLDGEALQKVGDGGYALGARAQQIRDGLFAKQHFTEKDLLAIQIDDRALFLQRWWQLLREQSTVTNAPARKALADASTDWNGRATTDSVSYRIVRAWRLAVHARILDGLTAPAQAALGKDFVMPDLPQLEGVAWPLVTQRPAHLLPRRFASWDALLEDAAVEVRDELLKQGPLSERTWGERNTAAICHPLAKAIPLLGTRLLCMPPDQLPGDGAMPRVQGPAFGASQRMVVSPGHEADGIVHMPGGQSGHPLSPFWGAGHDDWVHGRATPFLPGATTHTLTLVPPTRR